MQALKQDGASSRARFCAHLLGEPFDTCLLDDDGQSFLNWLVECGFQKVLLDWSHLSSSPKVKERTDAEVDRCAQGLLKLMNDFELVFVLSIRDNAYSNRQGERLLDRLLREAKPAKIQVLYNSSRGLGEKSTVYKCPESRYQDRVVGYAGGLGPGNVLQQLHEMRWVVPQGRHVFIEAQSGVRDKKKDEFSIDLCRDFAETVAKSSFNPAKGGEVYPQFDGSLVLGDSDTKVLYPDTDYEVTGIVQLTFSVKPAGTEQTANDANVFIAGSIAERYFELADIGGGLLPPQLTNDRPARSEESMHSLFASFCRHHSRLLAASTQEYPEDRAFASCQWSTLSRQHSTGLLEKAIGITRLDDRENVPKEGWGACHRNLEELEPGPCGK